MDDAPPMAALERERRRQGLSRRQLARKARVSHVTIWYIEGGRVVPRAATRVVLAVALGVEVNDVFPRPSADDVEGQ